MEGLESMSRELSQSFHEIMENIKKDVTRTQFKIILNANENLVYLYFRIGKIISDNFTWGNKFISHVAKELKLSFPNLKGFSERNLNYMKAFYEEYKDDDDFLHLGAKIPWKHNLELMKQIKDKMIRKWYMERCIEEGWSKSILIYQMNTNLYQRQIENVKHNNFNLTLKENSDLANYIMKDPYIFDLIELTKPYKERELENKMLERLKNVLLEFGNGFSFVGSQYKIVVGNQDFYIDLLFYHIKLKCYIAVELKTDEFVPEFGSKLGFYLSALDEKVKDENDNPSIGLLLCQSKNDEIVDYTLKYINKPVGVSEYKILNEAFSHLLKELPTEDDIYVHLDIDEKE